MVHYLHGVLMEVRSGDLFLTRNAGGEANNPSPGYYNHAAIFATNNWVVEAQAIPHSIIAVPIWAFFDRYPEILVLRNNDPITASVTAQHAFKFLGRNYSFIESYRPFWRWHDKDNCVSLVKRIYNYTTGESYNWKIPDDFLKSPIFTKVALKQ